jgi:DNA-binding NarL/FixJ family response regulator
VYPLVRVVLIDNHDAVRRGVRVILENLSNVQVAGEAANGPDGLRLAEHTKPHIAIVEALLPKLNAIEVTNRLKTICPGTRVLVLTNCADANFHARLLWMGVRGIVMKSDPEAHLLAAVEAIMAGKPYLSPTPSETLLNHFLASVPTRAGSVLTDREREIIQLVVEGRLTREIADTMNISAKTIDSHRSSAMRKLKLRTTAELVRYAIRSGMIEP